MTHSRTFAAILSRWIAASAVLALALPASGQADDRSFQAEAHGSPSDQKTCEVFLCGDATIVGYGDAEYRRTRTSATPISRPCINYTAVDTFTLSDGSMLTLDETGTACARGKNAPNVSGAADITGAWTVREGTGVFTGLTGEGTMSLRYRGGNFKAAYVGTIQD